MHLPAGLLAGLGQGLDEVVPVHVIQEDVLPRAAAAHDGIPGSRILNSKLARQLESIERLRRVRQR
jgi:hypothetical protein